MKTFKSPIFLIIGYLLAVGFNIPHLVESYLSTGATNLPGVYIWLMMIVIDLAILILAINKHREVALTFAGIVFLLNLYLYWSPLPFPDLYGDWVACLPGLLWSFIPAALVFYFADRIALHVEQEEIDNQLQVDYRELNSLRSELPKLRNQSGEDRETIDLLRREVDKLRTSLEKDRKQIEKFRPAFESLRSFNGEKITIGGVKACKCQKCLSITRPASNRVQVESCENCGERLVWK